MNEKAEFYLLGSSLHALKKKKILPGDLSNFYNCSIEVKCFSEQKKNELSFPAVRLLS